MKKSDLTDATREEANNLRIIWWTHEHYEIESHTTLSSLIERLYLFKDEEDATWTAKSDDYSGANSIILTVRVERTEKEVRREINKRIEFDKERTKATVKASLPKKERLALEVQELEKQLARKKRKLEKEQ